LTVPVWKPFPLKLQVAYCLPPLLLLRCLGRLLFTTEWLRLRGQAGLPHGRQPFFVSFAQASRKVMVRLKANRRLEPETCESGSRQK
jgi:hypothetical protein